MCGQGRFSAEWLRGNEKSEKGDLDERLPWIKETCNRVPNKKSISMTATL